MSDWSNPLALAFGAEARRPRLLLVDDQPLIIRLLYQIFSSDHDVFMATTGEQALAFCRQTPPDLILLDVQMPDMDGTEVSRQLKQDPELRDIPIIFVTGNTGPEAESRCWDAGAVDFISKPVTPRTVRARVRVHLALKFQADLLRKMAFVDGLTGVANRRYFDERLELEWRRSRRSRHAVSLMMVDVDYFKFFNDTYGHQAGDGCLQQVAVGIRRALSRPHDLVARYGGEEFACLLPETALAGAVTMARTIEVAVRELHLTHAASAVAPVVTVSVGVASAVPGQDTALADLLQQADQCLYQAKRAGRARVWPESLA